MFEMDHVSLVFGICDSKCNGFYDMTLTELLQPFSEQLDHSNLTTEVHID